MVAGSLRGLFNGHGIDYPPDAESVSSGLHWQRPGELRLMQTSAHRCSILAIVLAIAAPSWAQQPSQPNRGRGDAPLADAPNQVRGDELTPEVHKAVERGLERLASRQQADG